MMAATYLLHFNGVVLMQLFLIFSFSYFSVAAWKGVLPEISSYQITPRANMSDF